jgi:parallel beta-helix repeat protein
MSRKLLLLMLLALLIGTLNLASRVEKAKASGTIYIRADGSIDPPTAPITTLDNIAYTLTGNIASTADGIIVERDYIILDGAGNTLQGTEANESTGIDLTERRNVTVRNTQIKNFDHGIVLTSSNNNSIIGNEITANFYHGIFLDGSSNSISENNITETVNIGITISLNSSTNYNSISRNNITANNVGIFINAYSSDSSIIGNSIVNNSVGITLSYSSGNHIFHNNFINNTRQVNSYSPLLDVWDDRYPSGGNYWSNYTGTDLYSGSYQNETSSDGIGDTSYIIDENNADDYPLMAPLSFFDAGTWNDTAYYVNIVSNSTLSHFHFSPDEGAFVSLWVKGETETEATGFCRVAIPKDLLWVEDGWTVLYGSYALSYKTFSDDNCTYLYFTYTNPSSGFTTLTINGTHVIPEFPSLLILPMFMIMTLLAVIVYRRRKVRCEAKIPEGS